MRKISPPLKKGETGLFRFDSLQLQFNSHVWNFRCSAFHLMSHVHSLAAVVLGVNLAARCSVGASRWYRVSFPSIGPPLTLLLFSVA